MLVLGEPLRWIEPVGGGVVLAEIALASGRSDRPEAPGVRGGDPAGAGRGRVF